MNNAYFKPSLSVAGLINDDLREEYERFTLFLEAYYEWLQTSTIEIENVSGTFSVNETIIGSTSGARAAVKQVLTGKLIVELKSRLPFEVNETIAGDTSSATCKIISIKDNVVRSSGELLSYKNVELSVDKYVDYLKSELYSTLPSNIEANKRFIARKFRDFYQIKGNKKSYELLFRALFDESIELRFPGEDLLRVSDGKFEKTQIVRAVVTSNIFSFINTTITGKTSGAIGDVVDIIILGIAGRQVAEMTLKLVSGTFSAGETIEILDTPTSNTTVYGMVTGFTINDAGSGYAIDDLVVVTSNTGSEVEAKVSSISESPITAIKLNAPGYGYRLNTEAIINNSGTGGTGFKVKVSELANTYTIVDGSNTYTVGETSKISIVSRGKEYFKSPTVTLIDTTIQALGLLTEKLVTIVNTGSNYGVGNTLIITGGSGANAAGQVASVSANADYSNTILFEDGFGILSENSYDDLIKSEDWNVLGPIRRIEFTNFGDGYETANLPTITVSSTTGSNANLIPTGIQGESANVTVDVANNATGIGAIRAITISNFGLDYNTANITASLSTSGDGNANVTPIVTALGIKEGVWINDDGKLDYKIIQDSDFYQDFSYVIRTGLTFGRYSDVVKQIVHPAGMKFFGEIFISLDLTVLSDFLDNVQKYVLAFLSAADGGIIDVTSIIVSNANTQLNTVIIQPDVANSSLEFAAKEYLVSIQPDSLDLEISGLQEYKLDILAETAAKIIDVTSTILREKQVHIESDQIDFPLESTQAYNVSISPDNILIDVSSIQEHVVQPSYDIVNVQIANTFSEPVIDIQSVVANLESYSQQSAYIKYQPITGNVTYPGTVVQFKDSPISDYANLIIDAVDSDTFESIPTLLLGTGTDFITDFDAGDVIVANNEYLIVASEAYETTKMILEFPPDYPFTNVVAYKQIP